MVVTIGMYHSDEDLAMEREVLDILYAAGEPLTMNELADRYPASIRVIKHVLTLLASTWEIEISSERPQRYSVHPDSEFTDVLEERLQARLKKSREGMHGS